MIFIWTCTIHSDHFKDDDKKKIKDYWNNDKTYRIAFKGTGKSAFLKYIQEEYPNAIELENGFYTLEEKEYANGEQSL